MTRYVIGPDVAFYLASHETVIARDHQLLAPTLLRSQVLSLLYRAVRGRKISRREADRRLDYMRALKVRLLGDRVLQRVAWEIADQLGWPDTLDAEYLALTHLQADALVTLDARLVRSAKGIVKTAPVDELV